MTDRKETSFQINNLSKTFGENEDIIHALSDVSFHLERNRLNILLGASGSGKSTLLDILAGYEKQDSGEIFLEDRVPGQGKDYRSDFLSYVVVDGTVVGSLTLEENLHLVSHDEREIGKTLRLLGLQDIAKRKASKASKGEQMRTAIGMALLKPSHFLLLDEPTANLDETNAEKVFEILKKLSHEKTLLLATHDEEMANRFGDHIIRLDKGKVIGEKDNATLPEKLEADSLPKEGDKRLPFFPYLKLAFSKALGRIPSLLSSAVLLLLSFVSLFTCVAFSSVDQRASLQSAIMNLPNPVNEVVDDTVMSGEMLSKELEGNGFHPTSLYSGSLAFTLQAAFSQDVEDYIPEVDSLLSMEGWDSPDDGSIYCPIALSDETLSKLSEEDRNYEVGDVLPFSFSSDDPLKKAYRFVLTGVFHWESDSSNLFPAIIRKEDYLSYLNEEGIRVGTFSKAMDSIADSYLNFLDENGIENSSGLSLVFDSLNLPNKIVKSSMLSEDIRFVSDLTDVSQVGNVLYVEGALPKTEDWIWIPNSTQSRNAFAALSSFQNQEGSQEEAFFLPYRGEDGLYRYPIQDSFDGLDYHGMDSFCFAGVYEWTGAEDHTGMDNAIIVSDSLFDLLLDRIVTLGLDETNAPQVNWVTRDYLASKMDAVLSGDIQLNAASYLSSVMAFENVQKAANVLLVVGLVLILLALAIDGIYAANVLRSMKEEFAVLTILGKPKSHFFLLSFLALLPSFLSAMILSLIISYPIATSLLEVIAKSVGFAGEILSSAIPWAFLTLIGLAFLLLSAFSLLSLVFGKEHSVSILKKSK